MPDTRERPPARFCAAPWLETVLYNDGSYRICSRNHRVFGDWRQQSLESIWRSPELQAFRRAVAEGTYPDVDCASCHQAGTYQTLERILTTPVQNTLRHLVGLGLLSRAEEKEWMELEKLFLPGAAAPLEGVASFRARLGALRARLEGEGKNEELVILKKLENVLGILEAYWRGDENPPVVGPFRQVQLVTKCNARCVMCPGKFTGEIVSGSAVGVQDLPVVMAQPGHIVDFFCNGSEFLLFREWREVAQALKTGGVASLRLSTNGIMLTKSTVEYLVDNSLIGHLNVSLNAGTKDTLERVQKNVRWDLLQSNIGYLLEYAESKKLYFPLSFSFIVMRSNFHELPLFMGLVAEWKKKCSTLEPHVMIMSLESNGIKEYRRFVYEEHLSFAPRASLENAFREAARIAGEAGIPAPLYNFGAATDLRNFAGFPPFSSHPETDRENVEFQVRAELDRIFTPALAETEAALARGIEAAARRADPYPMGDEYEEACALIPEKWQELESRFREERPRYAGFTNLFACFPEHEAYWNLFREEWTGVLKKRFFDAAEARLRDLVREHFGWERESLRDHFGEKYAPVPVARMAPGARVLLCNHQVWRLVHRSGSTVYLKKKGMPPLETREDSVLGVFVFDPRPDAAAVAEEAREVLREFAELRPRISVLGMDEKSWYYLLRKGDTVYLLHPDGKTLRVAPQSYVWGRTILSEDLPPAVFDQAIRRAEFHWHLNTWKKKLIGQRKSRVLWELSRLYRICLRAVGIETPPDLVI